MERSFHKEVDDLVARVLHMGELSRRSVHEGLEAFAALDAEAARRVIELNQEINHEDVAIEARTLDLIALHQPMAKDLRTLGASLKIITYLDRIGRYGYDIAKAALALEGKSHVRRLDGGATRGALPATLPIMRDKALALLDTSLRSFRARDAAAARTVQPADDEVDALYDQIFRACVAQMLEEPRDVAACAQYILVARHLERVGDNAAKIAEKTIYAATGERRLETRD